MSLSREERDRLEREHPAVEIAAQIAPILGWKVKPYPAHGENDVRAMWAWARLVNSEGAEISIQRSTYPPAELSRVSISGSLPRDSRNRIMGDYSKNPKITVAISRGPEQITKEIQRRVLPIFLPMHAAGLEQLRRENAAAEAAYRLADDLARILGDEIRPHQRESDQTAVYAKTKSGAYVKALVRSYGGAEFRIDAVGDDARSLAQWIKDHLQERPEPHDAQDHATAAEAASCEKCRP